MFLSRIAPIILVALSAGDPFGEGEGYVLKIESSSDLERLTRSESSLPGVDRAGKFLVPVRDGDPELLPALFQNVNRYAFHQEFLRGEFPEKFGGLSQAQYVAIVERRLTRQYFAGLIFRFEGSPASYGFDIFTPDGIAGEFPRLEEVRRVYQQLKAHFTLGDPAYAPRLIPAVRQAERWVDPGFPISFAFGGGLPEYIPYTRAVNYGRVQVLTRAAFDDANARGAFSFQDILVLDHKPTDVEGVIAGAITESIQDDLGHLAIRTARRGTPNAFVRDATRVFAPWNGKLVRLEVGSTIYTVTEAAPGEAEAWWESHRPKLGEVPEVDMEYARLDAVWEIPLDGSVQLLTRYGGKAANFARLYALLEEEHRVPAFTVPFAHYIRFLETNRVRSRIDPGLTITYAQYIEEVISDPVLKSDSTLRFAALEKVRDLIEDGLVDESLVRTIALRVPVVFGRSDLNVRFRSSSNVEDLLEFNGAGLYSSLSGCAADDLDLDDRGPSRCEAGESKERGVARALKRVWASLWNFRAYEEREYYGIDHRRARMAVLVSEAFPNERANGVAFTGNPDVRGDRRFLTNVQLGDTPVVFPDPGVLPEKDILELKEGVVTRIIRSRPSTLVTPGQTVLTDDQLRELGAVMASVEERYEVELGSHAPDEVLLDFEFKIDPQGGLRLKQVRPFLISTTAPPVPEYRLHVPEGLTACGSFVERRPAGDVLRNKVMVGFKAGEHILRGDGNSAADILAWAQFSADGPRIEPLGSGVWNATVTQDPRPGYKFSTGQVFDNAGERVVAGFENLLFALDGPNEIQLDPPALTLAINPYFLTAAADFGDPPDVNRRTPFLPCNASHLPLYTVDVELEGGDSLHLEERYQDLEEGTGPAELKKAEVSLGGETRVVEDYWHLVYTAGHHNDLPQPEYWVILDPPVDVSGVGLVHAIVVDQGHVDEDPRAWLLDESFQEILPLEILSFTRLKEGVNPLRFRRGDVDFSGKIEITDAIYITRLLFFGGLFPCQDAADVDDLGTVEVADAILLLLFLYLGEEPPAAPGPFECGEDEDRSDSLPACRETGCN